MIIQRRREVYGDTLGLVPATGTRWGATLPIPGKGYIERMILTAVGDAAAGSGGIWRPWWVEGIPTSSGTLEAGEPVFPYSQRSGNTRGNIYAASGGGAFVLVGPFWGEPEGRRIGLSCYNMGANAMVMAISVVWRPSDAEQSDERLRRVGDR